MPEWKTKQKNQRESVRELEVCAGVVVGELRQRSSGSEEGSSVGADIERRVFFISGEIAEAFLFVEEDVGGCGGGVGFGSGSGLCWRLGRII